MDCVNHNGVSATAYCQNCGKALCAGCIRNAAAGQILCEPCWMAWQRFQQPFVTPRAEGPNPAAAAVLGLIPGVGAMYNGQFVKGLIHVVIFAVLVSAAHLYGVFGLLIAGWVFYQSFEAYHTARALRDGQPLPDTFGLNEVGNWLNMGARARNPGQPFATHVAVRDGRILATGGAELTTQFGGALDDRFVGKGQRHDCAVLGLADALDDDLFGCLGGNAAIILFGFKGK